ncbi:hypothetical protein Tco_1259451, partial [Tanacetum coccineum]
KAELCVSLDMLAVRSDKDMRLSDVPDGYAPINLGRGGKDT